MNCFRPEQAPITGHSTADDVKDRFVFVSGRNEVFPDVRPLKQTLSCSCAVVKLKAGPDASDCPVF